MTATPETVRTFIAAEIPAAGARFLRGVQENLKSRRIDLRWVKPDNIHLTLKFLGDVPLSGIEEIQQAAAAAAEGVAAVAVSAKGLGVFPNMQKPRVLWAGLNGRTHALSQMQQRLEKSLAAQGFKQERRPFKAHLTLGRIRGKTDPKKLADAVRASGDLTSSPFLIDTVTLFKSDLRPGGAVYTRIFSARLTPEGTDAAAEA